jgi:tetratricopeptide (TPR) repeat protein
MDKKKAGEAVGFYRAALVMRPDSGAVYNRLGLALQEQGLQDQAIEAYGRAVELGPPNAAALQTPGKAPAPQVKGRP